MSQSISPESANKVLQSQSKIARPAPIDVKEIDLEIESIGTASIKSANSQSATPTSRIPKDDIRVETPRASFKSQEVSSWASSIHHVKKQNLKDIRLEKGNLWQRIKETIRQFFKVFLKKDAQTKTQTELKNIFADVLPHMREQTFLQNALMLKEIEEIFEGFAHEVEHKTIEERERFLGEFQDQVKLFLQSQAQTLVDKDPDVAEFDKKKLAALSSALVDTVRKALVLPPNTQKNDTLIFSTTIASRRDVSRYTVSKSGNVTECDKIGVEPKLKSGEWEFVAYKALKQDVFREGALINGTVYYSLEDVVQALIEAGVKRERVGDMISLFAQNISNTLSGTIMAGYGLTDISSDAGSIGMGLGRVNGLASLEINKENQTYQFHSQADFLTYAPEDENSSGYLYSGEGRYYYDIFRSSFSLSGKMGDEYGMAHTESFNVSNNFLKERTRTDVSGFKGASDFLSETNEVLGEMEFSLLESELEKWDKILKTIAHVKHQVESTSGLAVDDHANVSKVKSGGKRKRSKQVVTREGVDVALKKLKEMEKTLLLPKGQSFEARSFSEIESMARTYRSNLQALKEMRHKDIAGYGQNSSLTEKEAVFGWAMSLLETHYERRKIKEASK